MKFCRLILSVMMGCILSLPVLLNAQEADSGVTIHVVQRGETLFRIAQRYELTTSDLSRLNGISNPNNIQVGQRLLVPAPGSNIDASAKSQPQKHTIRPGESLRSIAQFYTVTVEDLIALNQIADPDTIYVGQVLTISPDTTETMTATPIPIEPPSVEPAADAIPSVIEPTAIDATSSTIDLQIVATITPPTISASSLVHTVQRGETLFRIATKYGLTVSELASANSISDPTLIYAGQQLVIPNVEAPQIVALDLPDVISSLEVMPEVLVEGQTFRVRLTTSKPTNVSGTFLGKTLSDGVEQGNTIHTILQGIPIFTEAGIYPLDLTIVEEAGQTTPFTMNLQVAAGRYGSEYIRLLSDRAGLLDPTLEDNEQNLVAGVMSVFNPIRAFAGPMGLPAAATIISPFGTRRAYNGGAFDRYHSGTDFAGAPGTPVLATAPGRVVLAETLNVRGNATIIDHGWGVFTGYWHQSQIYVQLGDVVTTGQVIGTIGSTGRVTGAHLHWELWAGGVAVDPMQWVRLPFT